MDDKIIIIYSSYTEAQKRANKKYRENNKEKINKQRRINYQLKKSKREQSKKLLNIDTDLLIYICNNTELGKLINQ